MRGVRPKSGHRVVTAAGPSPLGVIAAVPAAHFGSSQESLQTWLVGFSIMSSWLRMFDRPVSTADLVVSEVLWKAACRAARASSVSALRAIAAFRTLVFAGPIALWNIASQSGFESHAVEGSTERPDLDVPPASVVDDPFALREVRDRLPGFRSS